MYKCCGSKFGTPVSEPLLWLQIIIVLCRISKSIQLWNLPATAVFLCISSKMQNLHFTLLSSTVDNYDFWVKSGQFCSNHSNLVCTLLLANIEFRSLITEVISVLSKVMYNLEQEPKSKNWMDPFLLTLQQSRTNLLIVNVSPWSFVLLQLATQISTPRPKDFAIIVLLKSTSANGCSFLLWECCHLIF